MINFEQLLESHERALIACKRTEADPYADAEDRGDARRKVDATRKALIEFHERTARGQ